MFGSFAAQRSVIHFNCLCVCVVWEEKDFTVLLLRSRNRSWRWGRRCRRGVRGAQGSRGAPAPRWADGPCQETLDIHPEFAKNLFPEPLQLPGCSGSGRRLLEELRSVFGAARARPAPDSQGTGALTSAAAP